MWKDFVTVRPPKDFKQTGHQISISILQTLKHEFVMLATNWSSWTNFCMPTYLHINVGRIYSNFFFATPVKIKKLHLSFSSTKITMFGPLGVNDNLMSILQLLVSKRRLVDGFSYLLLKFCKYQVVNFSGGAVSWMSLPLYTASSL